MSTVTASSGVKLKASTDKLSGSTTITGTDDRGNKTTLATITASGSPPKGGGAFSAGSNNGWSLDVTYNSNGTATGAASGAWAGVDWDPDVSVQVDAPGRPRRHAKSVKKSKTKRGKSGSGKARKSTSKRTASRSKVRRTKARRRK